MPGGGFERRGIGSGVIVSADGYILTNNHLVGGPDVVTAALSDDRTYTAKIVGTDERSDLAILKIDADGLMPAELGDSDALGVGDWVLAIRPDGTELWTKAMPDMMTASPMLAPDGTLYAMCRDKNLYAFRDVAGDLDHDGDIDLADLGTLGDCMTGPRIWGTRALTSPGCELLDFDRDWDVDVADFARIQIELSAP
jgi:hypothetical protein